MMIPYRQSGFLFLVVLWSATTIGLVISKLTQQQEDLINLEFDPLAPLGKEDLITLRSSWGITVNDQCLYEFVYQFEHPTSLPVGDIDFKGSCAYGDQNDDGEIDASEEPKIAPEDGLPYLQPRRFWERFPNYVWATMGFNHLSVDWLPCGRRPMGYKTPQYDMSFFRVTPEYRAQTMVCKLYNDTSMTVIPFEDYCDVDQEDANGMNFYIRPGAVLDRNPVVNMPAEFTSRYQSFGPIPHYGLRTWDERSVPENPNAWNSLPSFMSSYAGNLAMWQAHVPYHMISGDERQFHSGANRYFEATLQTLPDTWSVKYDESTGKVVFTIVGKAEICRGDFERAEKAAGGPPIFIDYDTIPIKAANDTGSGDGDKKDDPSSGHLRSIVSATILQIGMLAFALSQFL